MADLIFNQCVPSNNITVGQDVTLTYTLDDLNPYVGKRCIRNVKLYNSSRVNPLYEELNQNVWLTSRTMQFDIQFNFTASKLKSYITTKTGSVLDTEARGAMILWVEILYPHDGIKSPVINKSIVLYDVWLYYHRPVTKIPMRISRGIGGNVNDEGENPLLTVGLSPYVCEAPADMLIRLHYAQGRDATENDAYIDLTDRYAELSADGGVSNITITDRTFSNSVGWGFLLVYRLQAQATDYVETLTKSYAITRAFANVHMSGAKNGGVCFGGFSSSTDEAPKLESYYPAHLYGGIEQLNVQKKWVAEPTYASGFKAYEGFEPRVTRVGCFVFLDGMISPTASKSTSAAEGVVMATLPKWACPRVRVNLLMQGSTAAIWWMMVTPERDGTCTVRIARYRQTNSTSYTSVASGNQLPVTAMWIAADAYPAEEETNALADAD